MWPAQLHLSPFYPHHQGLPESLLETFTHRMLPFCFLLFFVVYWIPFFCNMTSLGSWCHLCQLDRFLQQCPGKERALLPSWATCTALNPMAGGLGSSSETHLKVFLQAVRSPRLKGDLTDTKSGLRDPTSIRNPGAGQEPGGGDGGG